MKKKCIAIAKKAMVWTLAATMLVATPLTASAAGLRGVYKVEDGWGNTYDQNGDDDTRTGTVTSTGSRSAVLDSDSKLEGIVLSETNVDMMMKGAYDPANQKTHELSVEFIWQENKKDDKLEERLEKLLTWKSGNNSIVSLNHKVQSGKTNEMTLVAKSGGKTTVTVSLDDYTNNIHFTTTANVNVKQIATDLIWDKVALNADAYDGVSLDLNEYVKPDPDTATDNITFEIVKDEAKSATLKNGILKLKKNKDGKKVTVVAIGEEVKKPVEITIKKATPATKVEIRKVGEEDLIKKYDWLVNNDGDSEGQKFEVVLSSKKEDGTVTTDRENCTDKITWSSKKPAIVEVKGNGKGDEVTLVAKSVGTAQITAQASSGKKATLGVTVRANLTGFEITAATANLYSGQSIKLGSNQHFAANGTDNFTDAGLTWSFYSDNENTQENKKELADMKKVATINAKTGVLTIKPDVSATQVVKVTATNAKAIGKKGDDAEQIAKAKTLKPTGEKFIQFNLTQIDITSIQVTEMNKDKAQIARAYVDGNKVKMEKGATVTIAADTSRTYKVAAVAKITEDGEEKLVTALDGKPVAAALNWASSKDTLATATMDSNSGNGTVKGIKKGTPTITVSGATKKGNKYVAIKATFKASVTVPTKSIVLSTKNSAIAATNKNQTITLKATLDKGTTSKAKDIVWTATKNGDPYSDIKGGKLKLTKDNYEAGDVFVVTAKIANAGVQSSMTLKVVKPSKSVQFVQDEGSTTKLTTISKKSTDPTFDIYTKVQMTDGTWAVEDKINKNNVAPVTYTVNKSGIVQLVGNKVTPIKKGTVKITAKTADGKTANLTVKVTD
ncbi:MAG: hypothetical protein HDR09_03510 [Lachnospiraceae bacterium]|nr:hypothetical protein [Lachnospiraceae bacterium]